jgi:C_GCAxxG_C_C family probable redox protein
MNKAQGEAVLKAAYKQLPITRNIIPPKRYDYEMTEHERTSETLFREGYNCAQAVFTAFCDVTGMDRETALRISSSFGGGMGRMREVCGAVSGMFMVAGMLYGYTDPKSPEKSRHYERVRELASQFRCENGSIVCRELLFASGEGATVGGDPSPRTREYYKKRPCVEYVKTCARILDEYISKNTILNDR